MKRARRKDSTWRFMVKRLILREFEHAQISYFRCNMENLRVNRVQKLNLLATLGWLLLVLTSTARAVTFTDADFNRHVEQLKQKLPSNEFSIVVSRPFVVIGDEGAAAVKEHAERTVKWAVDKLKQDFFTKDPNEILDIWLFRDAASYQKNALL